ncbi:hypothetical protein BRC90_04295 [Halobacteriales archaeon QS_4_69_34]|nr:MAG: hypothetical protein BRC90_04295 [Halobacteriales archaeon QS_4_69_34]
MATGSWSDRLDRRTDAVGLLTAFGATLAGFVLGVVALAFLSPVRGTLHSIELFPGTLVLRTAGADPVVVVASTGIGLSRLSLTGLPAVVLAAGGLAGTLGPGRQWSVAVGGPCGVAAAGTVPVLNGCHCGAGSTAPLWRAALSPIVGGPV